MKLDEAIKRIEALERELAELKAQHGTHVHYHYHQPQPVQPHYVPVLPAYPSPWLPSGPTWICGNNASYGPDH